MLADAVFDLVGQVGVFAQKLAGVVAALADFFAVVRIPGACLVHDFGLHAHVDDFAQAADAFTVQNVKGGVFERRCNFVLDDFDLGFVADDFVAFLDAADAADVDAHRRIELERIAAGGGFGAAEHDADLHANLVDEDDHAVGFFDGGGELAQGLAHEAGLQAGQAVAHVAFDFGARGECGDRIDHDQIDRAAAHQAIDNFKRLLAGVGLADEQLVEVDAQLLRVLRIQRMLGIDKGAGAAYFLHFGNHLQGERGFAR